MAKTRPHTEMSNTAMPGASRQPGDFPRSPKLGGRSGGGTPAQPSGEVRTQRGSTNIQRDRSDGGPTVFERGFNPSVRGGRERNPPGGNQVGAVINPRTSAMPYTGRQSATAPGELARPGSEARSAGMDARSSVPVSIQEGPNTRDRFTSLDYGKVRYDNAEIDDGTGTGRRARGTFRGNRRV
jgi:hypothetical protein